MSPLMYRLWDRENKIMRYGDECIFQMVEEKWRNAPRYRMKLDLRQKFFLELSKTHDIMQYIGRSCMKGETEMQHVYEDDVLMWKGQLFVVRFIGTGFWMVREDHDDVEPAQVLHQSLVQGNIYQNPKLLNEVFPSMAR
jgi:hypothetical protein